MEVPKANNVIKYDHAFILALKESPLVGVPDDFDGSFIEIYTDRRKKMYRNDGSNGEMLQSPSLNDSSSIVLGPPKISFASSKQAIKTKFDEEQSRYMMSSRRVSKQNSDDRSKNMYRNKYQRNMRDKNDNFEHNNLVSPTNGQIHGHNYQNYDNNRNSNEKVWKYNYQKDKSFEKDEESGQQYSNNSLNGDRKRNQFQQDKYNNNNMEDHKRNRDRIMKFDKDKYSLRMPNNDMRDRSQNKRDDGNRYSYKSPGLASAPTGKSDYHSYNRKQDDVPEWMNYSPLDDAKLGSNDKNKVDDFQIFKAKMNNRQGISSLSKTAQYNDKESFFDEGMRTNSEKNMINEIEKLNNENNRNIRNDLNELQNKKEFFDINQSDKMFSSVDQYFTNSLDNSKSEKLSSIFTNNIGYSLDNSEEKKSADNPVSGSKFSRFFSSSNDSVPEVGTTEIPPSHVSNFDVQSMQNPMVSSLLENPASLLNKTNTISSPMQQTSPTTNLPPPGNFTNITENSINNISNNSSTSNLHKNEDSSIIDSFISKYSIPPEKIVNNTNPPPLPLPQQLPINLQQQMSSPNMLNSLNQPNELPVNLINALQQPPIPQNMPPINFNNQMPFNQLPLNLNNPVQQPKLAPTEKKVYSEEDILKSMGITKTENINHEKTEKDIEQDKQSMSRVMDLLAKSMNAKLATNDNNDQGLNPNESIQSPAGKPVYINSSSGPVPLNNEQFPGLQSPPLMKQSKSNNESRKQSESNIMNNKMNEIQKPKKNSLSNKQSSTQILQNLVQHTIDSKLGGNIMNDKNNAQDDEIDEIESPKPINVKNEPMKTPIMEMNNINHNMNMNMNMNNLPFNQGMNNANIMNQLPMMGFNNNMYDQFSMNKEEMLPPQFMKQGPPIPMMPQNQNFMDSPQPNPNMFLQFNQNLPPQLQFPPQFQNEQQPFSLQQGIYPGMMSNMANQQSQQQMLMENLMTRRSIPVSMMLSENIGNSPTTYITVEELERQQMK